ncbi:ribokinase [Aquibacillus kalidii]|uniref:ribokinase n=1 Tax=Aquibacillus kalidii TaxID=2762597 RepID=UPI001644C7A4|nr:ribokinase [Aquibacillus kalidii]
MGKKIVVLGSLNMDIVVSTKRYPNIGETIHGENINYLPGGKGANQAVAVSKLTGEAFMLGVLGNDVFGDQIINSLSKKNLITENIKRTSSYPTGIASIVHLPEDNSIIVIPGANQQCTPEYVEEVKEVIINADVLLMQLEIPIKTVEYALSIAKQHQVATILNPAPATELNTNVLNNIEYVTPNESELASLLNREVKTDDQLRNAFLDWRQMYTSELIVTLGERGCAYWSDGELNIIPSRSLGSVVDTTGAGDSFNGALAYGIAENWSLEKTLNFAVTVSGLAVTRFGAQDGMPLLEEVKQHM